MIHSQVELSTNIRQDVLLSSIDSIDEILNNQLIFIFSLLLFFHQIIQMIMIIYRNCPKHLSRKVTSFRIG